MGLVDPTLTLEDNTAGSLTFRVYETNRNYGTIRKLYPVVAVIRNGGTIFKGRVIEDAKDFYNGKTVEVEGKLAFLNDSFMEPFQFSGTPCELFSMIIENHNAMVREWQQFKIGVVTVEDGNDYIVRSSDSVNDSWTLLKEKCINSSLGGHVRIRYEADGDYIDWLADFNKVSGQQIEFAKNIIDLSSRTDAAETYTAIRPVGAAVDGGKIDISSVNNGMTYLVNEDLAAEYGVIFAPMGESSWEDVTLPENLLQKARDKLYNSFSGLRETYDIRAIDLNLTNPEIEALDVCEYVNVTSKPHGIQGRYLLSKAVLHLSEPQNSVFYLGATRKSFLDLGGTNAGTMAIPTKISSFENDAEYIKAEQMEERLEGYANAEQVERIVTVYVKENVRDGFSPIVVENTENSETVYRLDITTANGTFSTPNLKGRDGSGASGSGSGGIYGFEVREDGHLWMVTNGEAQGQYFIDGNGHLICRMEGDYGGN